MKISHITLLALACGAAPLAVRAGVDIGVNVLVPAPVSPEVGAVVTTST